MRYKQKLQIKLLRKLKKKNYLTFSFKNCSKHINDEDLKENFGGGGGVGGWRFGK